MLAYGNRANAMKFARANNSDLLRALKHLMETRLNALYKLALLHSNLFVIILLQYVETLLAIKSGDLNNTGILHFTDLIILISLEVKASYKSSCVFLCCCFYRLQSIMYLLSKKANIILNKYAISTVKRILKTHLRTYSLCKDLATDNLCNWSH